MGKASGGKKDKRKKSLERIATRPIPNWPLLGLALIGIGVAGYLTVIAWTGQEVAGCPVGSDCDIVLGSRWSTLLGLPISFWGLLTYLGLATTAFVRQSHTHWKLAWGLSLFGLLFSVYLTTISLAVLEATCPYCITSAAIMAAILAMVSYQRPSDLPAKSFRPWLLQATVGSVVLVAAVHLFFYSGALEKNDTVETPQIQALAEHLAKTGAKFYGAYWCPHCEDQKEMFGASVHRLPYIECSPGGRRSPQAAKCRTARIRSYPTWFINGRRHEGAYSLRRLAELSGFKGDL
jgi:uncharacterized membrane protein/glutaredoxin